MYRKNTMPQADNVANGKARRAAHAYEQWLQERSQSYAGAYFVCVAGVGVLQYSTIEAANAAAEGWRRAGYTVEVGR